MLSADLLLRPISCFNFEQNKQTILSRDIIFALREIAVVSGFAMNYFQRTRIFIAFQDKFIFHRWSSTNNLSFLLGGHSLVSYRPKSPYLGYEDKKGSMLELSRSELFKIVDELKLFILNDFDFRVVAKGSVTSDASQLKLTL